MRPLVALLIMGCLVATAQLHGNNQLSAEPASLDSPAGMSNADGKFTTQVQVQAGLYHNEIILVDPRTGLIQREATEHLPGWYNAEISRKGGFIERVRLEPISEQTTPTTRK